MALYMLRTIILGLVAALPAQALELNLRDFYDLNRPASLEFDPAFCGLWIANESSELVLVTLDGEELRRFKSDLTRIKAIAIEDNNLLIADGFGGFQRLSKNGDALGAPFRLAPGMVDTEGMAVTGDGTIIIVEDDPARMMWITPDGTLQRTLDGHSLSPMMTEPQGIAIDEKTGHLLVVDDWEGLNSLFEFTAAGDLIGVTPLIEYGTDPEGIAIRPSTDTLFIAFDQGAGIGAFDFRTDAEAQTEPSGDCVMF
ncbi:MAG: hypothetical protein AAGF74_05100 [Pseudomonadota bacterium]